MKNMARFIGACYYAGAAADALAVLPLCFPEIARAMFGLREAGTGGDYLYASRVAASLMLGWTFLLLWASRRPVERRGVLLLTLLPVLAGLIASSVLAVGSGFVAAGRMLPLWVFYASIVPLYVAAYVIAGKIRGEGGNE
jgi:hypothetical protein